MALAATGQFELRPDGAITNSGYFNAALAGTDYSQQAGPQLHLTDVVTNGTTTVTSATGGFVTAMLGNGLLIVGDNVYEIKVINSSNSVTVDRSTANGGAGQTGNVGGAGTITTQGLDPVFHNVMVAGQKVWIRGTNSAGAATNYGPTVTALSTSGAAAVSAPITYEGYSLTRGDGGRAQIAAAGTNSFTIASFSILKNLFINSGAPGWSGPMLIASGSGCRFDNIRINSQPGAGGLAASGVTNSGNGNVYTNCLIDGSGTAAAALLSAGGQADYRFCEFRNVGAGSSGAVWLQGSSYSVFDGCLFWNNLGACARTNGTGGVALFQGCIFWGTLADSAPLIGTAIQMTASSASGLTAITARNCLFGQNAAYDVSHTLSDQTTGPGAAEWLKAAWSCNFFYTTGTGRYFQLPANSNDTSLTANPFNGSATGDFTLNSAAGGGATVTTNLCTTTFIDGLNTASVLAGPFGVMPAASSTTGMRSLWREFTNERSTVVIPDSTVDAYLNGGLQAMNRRVRYHLTDSQTAVTLVAGQQEYALPADTVFVAWVQWNGKELQKADTDEWRRRDIDWRNAKAGPPAEWAHYRDKLIFYPPPDAQAVAAQPAPLIRYVSSPPDISASGPEQVSAQDQRLAVYWGVQEFAGAHPDSALATLRAEHFQKLFDQEVEVVAKDYADRLIGR